MILLAMLIGCQPTADPDFQLLETRTQGELVFRDPETCRECHPSHVSDWEGSMHAYAMTDPVFHVLVDKMARDFGGQGGQFCTQCHSVPGFLSGETRIDVDEGIGWADQRTEGLSTVAQAGVSCDVCHSITEILEPLNARIALEPNGTVRGPIHDPVATTAHESVGSDLHVQGEFCLGCHNVAIPFADVPIAVENTGVEWQIYLDGGGDKTCQDCHMPEYQGQAAVDGPTRTLHSHTFVGADVALVDFPNKADQRAKVEALMVSALTLEVTEDATGTDVKITNLSGHSVPSGVASERRMWVEITLVDGTGAVVYETGKLDEAGDLGDGFPEAAQYTCSGQAADFDEPSDPDLWWFGSVTRGFCEEITLYPHLADAPIEEYVLEPHQTQSRRFSFPALADGAHTLTVRVLFRPIQAHLLRAMINDPQMDIDPAIGDGIPIYEMAKAVHVLP